MHIYGVHHSQMLQMASCRPLGVSVDEAATLFPAVAGVCVHCHCINSNHTPTSQTWTTRNRKWRTSRLLGKSTK